MPSELDRLRVARDVTGARFPIDNPELNIRQQLDEPVEQIATTDFYNGPVAKWVDLETDFAWIHLHHGELDIVNTVRDMGKLCYQHLAAKPSGLIDGDGPFGEPLDV